MTPRRLVLMDELVLTVGQKLLNMPTFTGFLSKATLEVVDVVLKTLWLSSQAWLCDKGRFVRPTATASEGGLCPLLNSAFSHLVNTARRGA